MMTVLWETVLILRCYNTEYQFSNLFFSPRDKHSVSAVYVPLEEMYWLWFAEENTANLFFYVL